MTNNLIHIYMKGFLHFPRDNLLILEKPNPRDILLIIVVKNIKVKYVIDSRNLQFWHNLEEFIGNISKRYKSCDYKKKKKRVGK